MHVGFHGPRRQQSNLVPCAWNTRAQ
jgi:hypothetical protein